MEEVTLVFPHQLFKQHPAIKMGRVVYLVEETLFFNQYNFTQKKILLHRASMKAYSDFLMKKGIVVIYIDAGGELADIRKLLLHLHSSHVIKIHVADVVDNWLQKRITVACKKYSIKIAGYSSPGFLNTFESVRPWFDERKAYFQTDFYIAQRRQRNILLKPNGEPEGGRWSYDAANRLRFPKASTAPLIIFTKENAYVKEAKEYVSQNYGKNYGCVEKSVYPTDFAEAEKWPDKFLNERFMNFGAYQDAIISNEHFLYHSVLTPVLNIGLLLPQQIVDKAMAAAAEYHVPLNSLEGFIRQLIGWREFIRVVYEREGGRQRSKNYWHFTRKIPTAFWKGDTGVVPVDSVIRKVLQTGYSHHIERLMVMGNFMLLCEFNPDEVYRWFMEMYIDSYDWVMVPNVYGMAQFADGGLMSTKPYISGSNYLIKMSDYKKGAWTGIWDSLFWRFMHVHRDFFLKNPRLGMLIKTFDIMPAEKRSNYIDQAERYLAELDQ